MSEVNSEKEVILLPVQRRDYGDLYVCLDLLLEVVTSHSASTTYAIYLENDSEVSYLRFATQLFSKVVNAGYPCLNIIIPHLDIKNISSFIDDQRLIKSEPSNKDEESCHDYIQVGDQDYDFGDGSADFYNKYDIVAVGGTFDRLHAGHRLLLTAATWAARQKLRIGITADALLQNKKHKELIASFADRSEAAVSYAQSVKPGLASIIVTELVEAAGPTVLDPNINALVVSKETYGGGKKINETRIRKGWNPLSLIVVDVLDTPMEKLSSSTLREKELNDKTLY